MTEPWEQRSDDVKQAQRDAWEGKERRVKDRREWVRPPLESEPPTIESPEPWTGSAIRGLMFAIPMAAVLWVAAYVIIKVVTR
jgi:hypothetical protein